LKNNLGFDVRFKEPGDEEDHFLVDGGKGVVAELQKSFISKYLSIRAAGLHSQWSAPFNINHIGSLYVKLENSENAPVILTKVSVLLEDATIFIILSFESGKWPYFIINDSSVNLVFFQQVSIGSVQFPESMLFTMFINVPTRMKISTRTTNQPCILVY
jgi:vacuolar protein sorting-associated protein 13A/C